MVCQAMPNLDANTCDLRVVVKEDASMLTRNMLDPVPFSEMGLYCLLESANVFTDPHRWGAATEVKEGIADDLTRTMVRRLTTAPRGDTVCSQSPKSKRFRGDLLQTLYLSSSKRVDGPMLE